MKSTKFINRIFSARQNNEEKILTQVYADFKYALEKGNTSTKQLDYVRQPDGTVNVTDKVNKEVTKINEKGDQLVMTTVEGYQTPPKDDIVAELEGTPSIPDDVFPANKGVEDKEKAGLVGNDDTHYPSITFSRVHRTYSQSDYFNCLAEIGITKDMFFSEKDEDKKAKQEKLKEAQSNEKIEHEKLKLVKADKDSTKADIMIQEGKALESEGKTQLAKSAVQGALSAGVAGAVKGAVLGAAGGPAGILAGALGGAASGAAVSVAGSGFESIPKINQGKKLIEQGKKLKEKEQHDKKIKDSGINTGKDELDEDTRINSRVGLNDKLQLIVGKMTAVKNAQSNQDKNKIVSEIKDLSQDIKDPNCLRYLKPAIKELEKRSIKDDDFETIVDDLITAFSQNPVTKVFTFSVKVNNINDMNKTKNFSNCMAIMSPATIEILSKHYSITPEQREFGEKMDKFKKVAKTAGKVALGAAAVGAAAYGADRYLNGGKGMQALAKGVSKVANSNVGQAAKNLGKATAQTAKDVTDKAVDATKEGIKKADEKLKKGGAAVVDKARSTIHNATKKASDVTEQEIRNFSYAHLNTRAMSKETRRILTAYYNK